MSETPLLALPMIESGQAQKHVTHNEALLVLDAMIQLSVKSRQQATPPVTPVAGDRYLAAPGSTGVWAGHDGALAIFEELAWRFLPPRSGWRLWVEDEERLLVFDGAAWRDLQAISTLNEMDLLGVNAVADAGNRLTVSSAATLFTHEGNDHRLKINKQAAADTATLLFQTNFAGRAELGLAGDDDFHLKVSADGSTWHEAITVDGATGAVTMPNTVLDGASVFPAITSLAGQVTVDESTDNAAVIQAALDGLMPAGGVVMLPPGRIRIETTLTLPDRVCLAGSGRDLTVLVEGAGLGLEPAVMNASVNELDGSTAAPGLVIRDLTFDGELREPPKWLSRADGTPITDPEADYLPGGCLAPAVPAVLSLTVAGGSVTGVSIVSGGSGYVSLPGVWISGDGFGARIGVTISGGAVATVFLQGGGENYTTATALVAGGGADPATALYAADRRNPGYADLPSSILLMKAIGPRIENVGFHHTHGNAISDAGCDRLVVRNCQFESGGQPDFVGSCIWTQCHGDPYAPEPFFRYSTDLTFDGNTVKGWQRSVATVGSIRPVFSNNIIDGWGESCFYVNSLAVSPRISGNRARNGVLTDIICSFVEGANDTLVSGNHVEQCDGRYVTMAEYGGGQVIGNSFVAPTSRVLTTPFGPYSERVGFGAGSQPVAGSQLASVVRSAVVLTDQDSSPSNAPKSFIMTGNRFSHDGGGAFAFALDFSRGATNAMGEVLLAGNDVFDAPGMALYNAENAASGIDPLAQFIVENNMGQPGGNAPIAMSALLNGADGLNSAANGFFQSGDFGWTRSGGWVIESNAANARTGNWVARNPEGPATSAQLLGHGYCDVLPGETVHAEVWLKATDTSGLSARIQVQWYDKDKGLLSTSSGNNITTDQPSYVMSSVAGIAPASAVFYRPRVICTKTAGTVWADCIHAVRRRDAATLLAAGTITSAQLGGDITTAGKALLDDANAAAQRTTLGLGSAAVESASAFAADSHSHAGLAPAGGSTGQVLRKSSTTDHDYAWATPAIGTTLDAALAADVSLATSNTWFDGPSVNLASGTWLVTGHITQARSATTAETIYGRISDGTVHHASQQGYHPSAVGAGVALSLSAVIVLAAATDIKLQCATSAGAAASAMKAALVANGSGANATQISAVKLA